MTSKSLIGNAPDTVSRRTLIENINKQFEYLMALGKDQEKNVCTLYRDNLVSRFGLYYLQQLNIAVKKGIGTNTDTGRDSFRQWINSDVMESVRGLYETDVFDNKKSVGALLEIISALSMSLGLIDEDDAEDEIEFIMDIPYQLAEMTRQSVDIKEFSKKTFSFEKENYKERLSISKTDRNIKLSYKVEINK